jgi:hypothetical protein
MFADVLGPASARTYGVVKERKVAITGQAIRTICRFFRIARLLPLFFGCFAEFFAPFAVKKFLTAEFAKTSPRTQRSAYPEPDGESLPESGNYRMAVTVRQSIEGELNHPK